MAQPGVALQVRVDHEAGDRNRPEPAADRSQLPDGDQEDRQRSPAERPDLRLRQCPGGELARGGARVPRVELGVDQPVQRHRERAGADHRERDPDEIVRGRDPLDAEERAHVREREREERVLDLDEPRKADRHRDGVHVWMCPVG